MLITIEDVLTSDELAILHAQLAATAWESGVRTAGPQAAQVKKNEQVAEQAQQLPAMRELVLNALRRSSLFFTAALPLKILPPFFNRYSGASNAYGFHVDNAMRLLPDGSGSYLRSDISATLFLTPPQDYDGGELVIDDTFGRHSVKLPAGSLVLYPSSSVHAVTPVTRGARVACFMFMQSMVRDAQQRRMLYDVDMALLKLRQAHGEGDEAVVQLTGVYHNLLRSWAEN